jgi:hypothetical protein
MADLRVVTDPREAADVYKRLIDPRRIAQIVLVATEDEPAITGFPTPQTLPISAWMAVNPTCHAVFKQLDEPPISAAVARGTGLAKLGEGAATLAFERMSAMPGTALTYLQFKSIPAYPPNRTGPREFALLTICRDDAVDQSDVVHLREGELLPSCDAAGTPLVELRVAADTETHPELAAHLQRNELMWDVWIQAGVTETTSLPVDFHFYATKQPAAESLRRGLEQMGMAVALKSTRTLLFLKGWELTATETARWTLRKLQARTRDVFELASSLDVSLEGIGAAMPATHGGS